MCSPQALVGVGAAAGAYGAYTGQAAENQAREYSALISERNASLSELGAQNAIDKGNRDAALLGKKVSQLKSTQRTAFGASGALVDSGSAGQVVQDTAAMGEQDALTIRYNASLEAYGKRAEASNSIAQARLTRMGQRNPFEAGALSLLGSAGSVGLATLK